MVHINPEVFQWHKNLIKINLNNLLMEMINESFEFTKLILKNIPLLSLLTKSEAVAGIQLIRPLKIDPLR